MKTFEVKTGNFEGPLDVLLTLIEKRKLLINHVSLAQVTDDFLAYLKERTEFPVAEAAQFVLIASTLLLIKSKSLLPTLTLSEEEEHNIDDLTLRLNLLETYRTGSVHVHRLFGARALYFRQASGKLPVVFTPPESALEELHAVMGTLVSQLPKPSEPLTRATVRTVISLEEMVERLRTRIEASMHGSFRDLAGVGKAEKVEVVVSFLALLELVKQGLVLVEQAHHRDDIIVRTDTVSLPRYG